MNAGASFDASVEKLAESAPESDALLGNKTGNVSRRASRGFQRFEVSSPAIENRRQALPPWMGVSLDLVEKIDPETGEIITYRETSKGLRVYRSSRESRAERYALKSVVNLLFPNSRTSKCCRVRRPDQAVAVCKDHEHEKAFYSGLIRCGSPWWCPVCAATISERRRAELASAVATAKLMGLQVLLMTCTVPHGLGDDVGGMLDLMLKAWRKMVMHKSGRKMFKLLGAVGTIRALEVTDGSNGFHPHLHVLVFADAGFRSESFQAGFLPLWQHACVKVGLPCPSDSHGLRVDDGSYAEQYATKWGLEDEMVRGHQKASKDVKGMTPWDMLRDVLKNVSERSRARFRVYANAFKGRRQLVWSNGLKERLGVGEVTDEELIEMDQEHASVLSELTVDEWRAVLANRCEAALLDVAERNPQEIKSFLESLQAIEKARKSDASAS